MPKVQVITFSNLWIPLTSWIRARNSCKITCPFRLHLRLSHLIFEWRLNIAIYVELITYSSTRMKLPLRNTTGIRGHMVYTIPFIIIFTLSSAVPATMAAGRGAWHHCNNEVIWGHFHLQILFLNKPSVGLAGVLSPLVFSLQKPKPFDSFYWQCLTPSHSIESSCCESSWLRSHLEFGIRSKHSSSIFSLAHEILIFRFCEP